MSHYCRLCGRHRANERFSGGGHRIHVCRECQRIPKTERLAIEAGLEIESFLFRQRISKKNLDLLRDLCESSNVEIAALAAVVLEVARIAPYKRKRFRTVWRKAPHLLDLLVAHGVLEPREPLEEFEEFHCPDGWIPAEHRDDEPPPSSEPAFRDDIPF